MPDLFSQKSLAIHEELTQIRGIGVAKKRRLASLGIRTVHDLATVTASDLILQLKDQGQTVSPTEVEAWIVQAQLLSNPLSPATMEPMEQQTEQNDRQDTDPAIAPSPVDQPTEAIWQPFASFVVEFQTRQVDHGTEQRTVIRHLELDTIEVWSGFTTNPIQAWMNTQLQAQFQMEPQVITAPVTVEIQQLRLLRSHRLKLPMVVDHTRRLFPEAVNAGEPFTLETTMQLVGLADANAIGQQIIYRAQCYARHMETGTILTLGDIVANVPATTRGSYTALLTDLVLEQPGSYRLQVIITIQNALSAPGCIKVPLLQVVQVQSGKF